MLLLVEQQVCHRHFCQVSQTFDIIETLWQLLRANVELKRQNRSTSLAARQDTCDHHLIGVYHQNSNTVLVETKNTRNKYFFELSSALASIFLESHEHILILNNLFTFSLFTIGLLL